MSVHAGHRMATALGLEHRFRLRLRLSLKRTRMGFQT